MSTVIPIEDALALSIIKNAKIRAYLASPSTPTSHVAPIPDYLARSIVANPLIMAYVGNPNGHASYLTGHEPPIDDAFADGILKNAVFQDFVA
jgi:hypothetical protein